MTHDSITKGGSAKHSTGSNGSKGGSNYTFADGSARFLRFGHSTTPVNMWAVLPAERKGL